MSKMMSRISLWVSDATLEVFFLPYSARMRSVFECRSKTRTFMNEKGLAIEDTENVKFNKLYCVQYVIDKLSLLLLELSFFHCW